MREVQYRPAAGHHLVASQVEALVRENGSGSQNAPNRVEGVVVCDVKDGDRDSVVVAGCQQVRVPDPPGETVTCSPQFPLIRQLTDEKQEIKEVPPDCGFR